MRSLKLLILITFPPGLGVPIAFSKDGFYKRPTLLESIVERRVLIG